MRYLRGRGPRRRCRRRSRLCGGTCRNIRRMAVVSNSSPLIVYSKNGLLHLLPAIFGEIWIPPAVYREVVGEGRDRAGSVEIAAAPWIIRAHQPPPVALPVALADIVR